MEPGPVHVGFVVDKVAFERVFILILHYSPVSIIPLIYYICISFI